MMLKFSLLITITHVVMSRTTNETTHPNVIIMHVNNLNWNDLGIHVNRVDDENSTPNIDRLAYAGIILNRFYANGGSDSLYSGCYQRSSYGNPNLLSTYFERNGYQVNILSSENFTKVGTFLDAITDSISNDNEPFLLSVDFGYLGYDIKISVLDEFVGTMLSKLYERDILDNTVIVFLSLPTESAYELNTSPIEFNIRRVAIIYSKLFSHLQSVSNHLIHVSDILPTLVAAAHLKWHTRDRIFIDGINQWQVLNNNGDNVRTKIFGDHFYIENYTKLSYGAPNALVYDNNINEEMESVDSDNYDFVTYMQSLAASEAHNVLDDITSTRITHMRIRAKVHCNKDNDVDDIKCSRLQPCLFDLHNDPCEFDDMHEDEYDLKRNRMIHVFEDYLNNGIVKDLSAGRTDEHATNSSDVIGDPILTPTGGVDAFLTLGLALGIFLLFFIVIVCIKERCNSRRSVYVERKKNVTFKDESGIDANGISSISASVQNK